MKPSPQEIRRILEMQGFIGLTDQELDGVDMGSRVAPALGSVWVAVATALASPAGLAALVPFAVVGAVLGRHPFDAIYNHGLRHLRGDGRLPRYGAPRRFAMGVAALWLCMTAISLSFGATALGTAFGLLMVGTGLEAATTGFCILAHGWTLITGLGRVDLHRPATVEA